jgi:hypothetical protein
VIFSDRPTENTGSAETVWDSVMIFSTVWCVSVCLRAVRDLLIVQKGGAPLSEQQLLSNLYGQYVIFGCLATIL